MTTYLRTNKAAQNQTDKNKRQSGQKICLQFKTTVKAHKRLALDQTSIEGEKTSNKKNKTNHLEQWGNTRN